MGLGHTSRRSVVRIGIVMKEDGFVARIVIAISRTTCTRNILRTCPSLYAELYCSFHWYCNTTCMMEVVIAALLNGAVAMQPRGQLSSGIKAVPDHIRKAEVGSIPNRMSSSG